jgi:hypothetical protein
MTFEHPTDELLERAARRTATGPAPLVAPLIKAWRKGFHDVEPAHQLGCSARKLSELALCLRPRPGTWLQDVSEISRALEIDADRLTAFLRAAEAIERFQAAHPAEATQEGRLMAARDRDED